jgi:hypothetical protein
MNYNIENLNINLSECLEQQRIKLLTFNCIEIFKVHQLHYASANSQCFREQIKSLKQWFLPQL